MRDVLFSDFEDKTDKKIEQVKIMNNKGLEKIVNYWVRLDGLRLPRHEPLRLMIHHEPLRFIVPLDIQNLRNGW